MGEIVQIRPRDRNPVSRASSRTCGCSGLENGQQDNRRLYLNTGLSGKRPQTFIDSAGVLDFCALPGACSPLGLCGALFSTTSPALHANKLLFLFPLPREEGYGPEGPRNLPWSAAVSTKCGV